jgi:hypothetical protein
MVALAKALYVSRRISMSQYVIYAVSAVEGVHDGRLLYGAYDDELRPINQALREVEKRHGLAHDQYWPRGEGPEEYGSLNRQFEAVLDARFLQALREFDLCDLAELKEQSPEKFDALRERGRRSVFHRGELAPAIRDVVLRYEDDARQAASVGAYTAAVTSLGAGVEGLLLLRSLRSTRKAGRIARGLKGRIRPRSPDDPSSWTFETLIEVCLRAGWLRPIETPVAVYDTAALAHVLRRMRNHVHPGRSARERPWSETDEREYRDADAIYVILLSTLGKVQRGQRKDQAEQTPKQHQ